MLSVALAQVPAHAQPRESSTDSAGRLAWWRAARFGMFIHWGPVSLKGTEIGWSRGAQVPAEEYDHLFERFNPTAFDADQWVRTAKAAGMKYIVITSKHHDGFCLWDSRYTDYDIAATPFKRDVLEELSDACRRHGVRFCVYYSICDWWHPDYPTGSPGGKRSKPSPNMPRYFEYLKNQVREIIENYGPLGIVWFDGQWEKPWTLEHGDELETFLRKLQPDVIINNRVGKARANLSGTSKQNVGNPGDYDTPEQRIGAFDRARPWETCMTICRQWAWKPDDQMKSLEQCLQSLVRVAGGDGNFLFNIGPMPDGRIEPRQAERLREMGAWLETHGESIYGTRGGPFKPGPHGASTCNGNRVYLHVFDWPEGGDAVRLPPIPARVTRAAVLDGGAARFTQTPEGIEVAVSPGDREETNTVVMLELDVPALSIEPVAWRIPSNSLAFGKSATASNTFRNLPEYAAERAFDDDEQTRWATDWGTKQAWLEVDLGALTKISRIRIDEAVEFGERIRRFQLEYQAGDAWRVAVRGTTVGRDYSTSFPPVTARHVRLNILEATEGPTIRELQLFAGKE
jgi:alpha-L-fucosidase